LALAVGAVYALSLGGILWHFHPHQNVYFNDLIGGIAGAAGHHLFDWQTSYGNPYKQGVNWLNDKAESGARLAYLDGTMQAISPLWLRDDIRFGSHFSGFEREGEYIISLVYPEPPHVFEYNYLERFLEPVHVIAVDGVPLLNIWKNDETYVKEGFDNGQASEIKFARTGGSDQLGEYWELAFDGVHELTSVTLDVPSEGCVLKEGVFKLADWFVPYVGKVERSRRTYYFPAEPARHLRLYGLTRNSCLLNSQIVSVRAFDALTASGPRLHSLNPD
jgi:hypothetical protein